MSQTHATCAAPPARHSPSEPRLTAGVLFLWAALAALWALATNIILPAFPEMGEELGVSVRELSATLPPDTDLLVAYSEYSQSLAWPGFRARGPRIGKLAAEHGVVELERQLGRYTGLAN